MRVLFLLLFLPLIAQAQTPRPVPYPVFHTPDFTRAIENGTRNPDGTPGPNYWQNRAEYTIHATLSPATETLRATSTVRYTNNSPDALPVLTVYLLQNIHREGGVRNRPADITGGMTLGYVSTTEGPLVERASVNEGTGYVIDYGTNGTIMQIRLPQPLAPGSTVELGFGWSFRVPQSPTFRMGTDAEVFYLGYWYPQIAVYDDVQGWEIDPYMGNGEHYMAFADYDVYLTVPHGWLVGATGELQNADAVLTPTVRQRLDQARTAPAPMPIVRENEREPGVATARSATGTLTWHFRAENVRDFAFGTSDRYVWDATHASTGEGTAMIHAFYRPGTASWNRSAEFAKFSIEHLSEMLFPYPYPHMTTVEGIIGGGMEFPMITLIGGARSDRSLFSVTYHEIAHMWFPMVVGQDEKDFTWMDEGLTSFNTTEGNNAFWNQNGWLGAQSYYSIAGTGEEVESMRHNDRYPVRGPSRGIASYNKPAVALNALRGIVGAEKFWQAYREYADRWKYKHPYPYDLFNTFEDVIGEDLDWFWTPLFYTTWTHDLAIGSVRTGTDAVTVAVEDLGLTPLPATVRVTYADGKTETQTIPVATWLSGARTATLTFPGGPVQSVEIDPDRFLPDVQRGNNVWKGE